MRVTFHRVLVDVSGCFNPCCIGLAIAGHLPPRISGCVWLFQSLLYWISHCGNKEKPLEWLAGECFNPCCIGLAIAGSEQLSHRAESVAFQSLLYWISHCGLKALALANPTLPCFNPCCIGLAIAGLKRPDSSSAGP